MRTLGGRLHSRKRNLRNGLARGSDRHAQVIHFSGLDVVDPPMNKERVCFTGRVTPKLEAPCPHRQLCLVQEAVDAERLTSVTILSDAIFLTDSLTFSSISARRPTSGPVSNWSLFYLGV